MYYSYVLQSSKTNRFYYGSSSNIEERLKSHNRGKVKATKHGIPWNLQYFETFSSRKEAVRREMFYKSIDGYRWLKEHNIT